MDQAVSLLSSGPGGVEAALWLSGRLPVPKACSSPSLHTVTLPGAGMVTATHRAMTPALGGSAPSSLLRLPVLRPDGKLQVSESIVGSASPAKAG